MVGQTRVMLEATPPDGRYRETVIDHSNMYHRSFGHVPIHTAIHPCGKGSNRLYLHPPVTASVFWAMNAKSAGI